MVNKVKNMFALTDTGAKGVVKASVASFFMYIAYILPMMIMMYFVYQVLGDGASAALTYVGGLVIVSIVMYVLINYAYNTTYSETYKEAANLRVLIANTLKSLPLSYFSRHNISDLSQTVMQDVADMEHALSHAIPEIFGFIAYFIFISVGLVAAVPLLGLALISPIIISALLLLTSKKLQVRVTTKYFYKLRENADAFQEAIEMHQEIKSYGQEEAVRDNIRNKIEDTEKLHVKTEFAQALPTTCSTTIIRFSLGFTVLVGTILFSIGQKYRVGLCFVVAYCYLSAGGLPIGGDSVFPKRLYQNNLVEIFNVLFGKRSLGIGSPFFYFLESYIVCFHLFVIPHWATAVGFIK